MKHIDDKLKNIIESLLFASPEPLNIADIKNIIKFTDTKQIKEALQALEAEYEARGGGFYLTQAAGAYQIRTRPEYAKWLKYLLKPNPMRLSKPALETLAIIAYNQPVIRSDIEHIRGVECGGILKTLLERRLIRIMGRKDIPGKPMLYGTTKQFLQAFDLKELKDLPTIKEIKELTAS